jgi:GNAT superfamily N-acetyltransferase
MAEGDDSYFVLSWAGESSVFDVGEPDELIYETRGEILAIGDSDNGRTLVGRFGLYYADIDRALNQGVHAFDVFDAYALTAEYYEHLYGENAPDFSDRVMKLVHDEVWGSNVLILDRVELLPQYRGRGLGLDVKRHMMKRFGAGAALVALKAFPLQLEVTPSSTDEKRWRANLGLGQFIQSGTAGTKKLVEYYGRVGFQRIGRTPYMVRTATTAVE